MLHERVDGQVASNCTARTQMTYTCPPSSCALIVTTAAPHHTTTNTAANTSEDWPVGAEMLSVLVTPSSAMVHEPTDKPNTACMQHSTYTDNSKQSISGPQRSPDAQAREWRFRQPKHKHIHTRGGVLLQRCVQFFSSRRVASWPSLGTSTYLSLIATRLTSRHCHP